jgi:outer membrane receptor protein involved in Fe transport
LLKRLPLILVMVSVSSPAFALEPALPGDSPRQVPLRVEQRKSEIVVTVQTDDLQPIVGARVTLTGGRGPRSQISGADGKCRFLDLDPADYTVVVQAANFQNDRTRLHVESGQRVSYNSYLDKPGQERVLRVTAQQIVVENFDPNAHSQVQRSNTFINTAVADSRSLQAILNTAAGVQSDANGQVHVRGEHKSLSYEFDGINVPNGLSNNYASLFDPRFVDGLSVKLGNYDSSEFGQLGAVLNLDNDVGKIKPYIKLEDGVGDHGFLEEVFKAEGSNKNGTFDYVVGVHQEGSALRTESPQPSPQNLHNTGRDTNIEVRLTAQPGKDDRLGLVYVHQNDALGVPNDLNAQAAGVSQNLYDRNDLALLSWDHTFSKQDAFKLGLVYFSSGERYTNNGVFTPFTVIPASVSADLNAANNPATPTNPGSPYLPSSDINIHQFQQQFEFTHKFSDQNTLKLGANADFISSAQSISVIDAGGGGGLPNITGSSTAPTLFSTSVARTGFFGGIFFSDTVALTDKFSVNYGVRAERFDDGLGLNTGQISPRVNFLWNATSTSALRLSYNSLFQPPPLEIDVSGLSKALPQKVDQYEISYELQPAKELAVSFGYVYKSFKNQLDVGLLIPNSQVPIFAPLNFDRAYYDGVEFTASTKHSTGLNGFLSATYGVAKPTEGSIFEGAIPPSYNDHDQRAQVTGGVSESWGHGWSGESDFLFGTGYPQDTLGSYNAVGIYPFGLDPNGARLSHFYVNASIGFTPVDKDGNEKNGVGFKLQVLNLFDNRSDLNFLSGFSGTRFSLGRRVILNTSYRF